MTRTRPILLYDNDCGVCSRFASIAKKTSKGWLEPVGLFTKRGTMIKSEFFNEDDHPDDMFWLLLGDMGYGGRSGLLPLVREIIRGRVRWAFAREKRAVGPRVLCSESLVHSVVAGSKDENQASTEASRRN